MSTRIAITGLGAVTPFGDGARVLYDRWVAGECRIEGGEARCTDFEPLSAMSKKDVRRCDRFAQLALAAAAEAVGQAFGDEPPYEREEVGCVIGTGFGGINSIEEELDKLRESGPSRVSPLGVPRLMGNAAAAMIAMRYGLEGECYGLLGACASGSQAIGDAKRMLDLGVVDAVVAGGADAISSTYFKSAYHNMGATSKAGVSRPWDRRRDGFIPGEGAGVMVLEREEDARARNAKPIGYLIGYGASCDAHHLTAPRADAAGATRAIERALRDAGVAATDVAYVNAHGTSTQLNDRMETQALKLALGEHTRDVKVSSLKSAIGHLQGGAGAAEAIATVQALNEGFAPPTLGLEDPDDGLDLDYVAQSASPLPPRNGRGRIGISESFGFGGHNACLVLQQADG